MATGTISQDREFLFRLQTLIIHGGTLVVKSIFDQKVSNVTLSGCLSKEKTTINRLRVQKTITKTQYDQLYPQSRQPPTSADFELTLLICLLRNLRSLGLNPNYSWNLPAQPADTSVEADLCRVKGFQKEVAHISPSSGLQQMEFQTKWTKIEQVLLRLNSVPNPVPSFKRTIDGFKNDLLDPVAEKRIQTEIKQWRIMEKELETKTHLIKKNVTENVKEVMGLNDNIKEVKKHGAVLSQVKILTKDIEVVKKEVKVEKHIEENVKTLTEDVKTVKHSVDVIPQVKGNIKTLTEDATKVKQNVEVIPQVQGNITALTEDVSKVKQHVEVISQVQGHIKTLTEDVKGAKENIAKEQKYVEIFEQSISDSTENVQEVRQNVRKGLGMKWAIKKLNAHIKVFKKDATQKKKNVASAPGVQKKTGIFQRIRKVFTSRRSSHQKGEHSALLHAPLTQSDEENLQRKQREHSALLHAPLTQSDEENLQRKQRITFSDKKICNPSWEPCMLKNEEAARDYANNLIKKSEVPDKIVLNELCEILGKRDTITTKLCQDICAFIRGKNSKIVSVWPSYLCSTIGTSSESNIVFVVTVRQNLISSEIKEIGYVLKVRLVGEYSDEARHVMSEHIVPESQLSLSETQKLKTCINMHASELMKRHSLLSIISPSPVRSKGYKIGRVQVHREPCIVFYVHTKSYIPLAEERFQTEYDGIPVDVREGSFDIYTGPEPPTAFHKNLKMGCQIGNEIDTTTGEQMSGTLGGFIDHPHYGLCGFTCAHVLLNSLGMNNLKTVGTIKWPNFGQYGAVYQPAGTSHVIGRLVQCHYAEGNAERIGFEVALFQIEHRHPNAGDFATMQMQDQEDEQRFDSGNVHGSSRMKNDPLVKFGCVSYKTEGEFVLNEAATSVKSVSTKMELNKCSVILHNQLEVKSKQSHHFEMPGDFSLSGDSGSLVFMKGSDGEYACVGMVEGGSTYGTSIITHITPILEAIDVSRLKNFETQRLANELRNINTELNTLKAEVENVTSSLQFFGNLITNDLREIKSNMSN